LTDADWSGSEMEAAVTRPIQLSVRRMIAIPTSQKLLTLFKPIHLVNFDTKLYAAATLIRLTPFGGAVDVKS